MLSVVNNIGAMNAQRQFNITGDSIKKSMEKLSSGYRINRAADDAAGLTISEKMRSLIRGMNQGSDNIQDGISVMQIADGALAEVHGMLHRMTELSVKAANGTNTEADRAAIQAEINELSAEITRIGKTTEFNTMPILDDITGESDGGKVTSLVSCESADNGYLTEAIKINGNWYSSATLDFSGVTKYNIAKLNGAGFSFSCSQSCSETFDIKFATDGTPSSAKDLSGNVPHYYTVDISKCKNGADVVNTVYNFVQANKPVNNSAPTNHLLPGDIPVSHSNNLAKTGSGKLVIFENWQPFSTKEEAKAQYADGHYNANSGKIGCKSLTGLYTKDVTNSFRIQCSNVVDDCEYIETYRMNASILGVDDVNVSTQEDARRAIGQIDLALDRVSEMRSAYGAFQNRLEHSFANNENKAENMTAAESRIRDTDMSSEMVSLTKSNILSQAGTAMLSQAMQTPQSVLQLLS